MVMDYFFDEQIRRYLQQFMRIFSLIKIQSAPDENGAVTETTVPVYYGDMNRMVAHILRENSENTSPPTNVMSVHITNIRRYDEVRRDPMFVGKINIDERRVVDGEYTNEVGNRYSIERYMPSPYMLSLNLDIWTMSTTTKLQILEQIMMIFNPSLQIQQHDNMLDWSVMTEVTAKDYTWTNRSIPQGQSNERDVATISFEMPIYINPPAKVNRKKLIKQIVTNIYQVAELPEDEINKKLMFDPIKNCFDSISQVVVTPGNHNVKIGYKGAGNNELILLDAYGNEDPTNSWSELLEAYGEYNEDTSTVTLNTDSDIENQDNNIVGTIRLNPARSDSLYFNVDVDTLPAILQSGPATDIINPLEVQPGNGLPLSSIGQRYLLLDDIPTNTGTNPWGSISAKENDIIEFNGSNWFISFDASEENKDQYISVMSEPAMHYCFDGSSWNHTYFGLYCPGFWRVRLQQC